ncbi:hypothetical protein D3C84_687400 [compost metagenome]
MQRFYSQLQSELNIAVQLAGATEDKRLVCQQRLDQLDLAAGGDFQAIDRGDHSRKNSGVGVGFDRVEQRHLFRQIGTQLSEVGVQCRQVIDIGRQRVGLIPLQREGSLFDVVGDGGHWAVPALRLNGLSTGT